MLDTISPNVPSPRRSAGVGIGLPRSATQPLHLYKLDRVDSTHVTKRRSTSDTQREKEWEAKLDFANAESEKNISIKKYVQELKQSNKLLTTTLRESHQNALDLTQELEGTSSALEQSQAETQELGLELEAAFVAFDALSEREQRQAESAQELMEALIMLEREGERSETSEKARMRMGTIEEGEEEMSYHFKEEEEVELEEGSSYDLITDVSLTSPVVQRPSSVFKKLQLIKSRLLQRSGSIRKLVVPQTSSRREGIKKISKEEIEEDLILARAILRKTCEEYIATDPSRLARMRVLRGELVRHLSGINLVATKLKLVSSFL